MPDTVPFCPDCGPSADPSVTKCPRCGQSTYPVLRLRQREFQPTSAKENQDQIDMLDPQRAEKIPLLIFFLAITFSILAFGLFAPDSQFTDDSSRGRGDILRRVWN